MNTKEATRKQVRKQPQEATPKNHSVDLTIENHQLKKTIVELTDKCEKLENESIDMEKLLKEQFALMKALNVRTNLYYLLVHCVISSILVICKELV